MLDIRCTTVDRAACRGLKGHVVRDRFRQFACIDLNVKPLGRAKRTRAEIVCSQNGIARYGLRKWVGVAVLIRQRTADRNRTGPVHRQVIAVFR